MIGNWDNMIFIFSEVRLYKKTSSALLFPRHVLRKLSDLLYVRRSHLLWFPPAFPKIPPLVHHGFTAP
jgi:hypothetical protein